MIRTHDLKVELQENPMRKRESNKLRTLQEVMQLATTSLVADS